MAAEQLDLLAVGDAQDPHGAVGEGGVNPAKKIIRQGLVEVPPHR